MSELKTYMKSNHPLIAASSFEEDRFITEVIQVARDLEYQDFYTWSSTEGMVEWTNFKIANAIPQKEPIPNTENIDDFFIKVKAMVRKEMKDRSSWSIDQKRENPPKKQVFLMLDPHPYLRDPLVIRNLRDIYKEWGRVTPKHLVLLCPHTPIPEELTKSIVIVDFLLPSRSQVKAILTGMARALEVKGRSCHIKLNERVDEFANALVGLTEMEIRYAFLKILVIDPTLSNEDNAEILMKEKEQLVKRSGLLEFKRIRKDIKIGGYHEVQKWLDERYGAYTQEGKDYGLPTPKGFITVGIQGAGKSLLAETVATRWKLPCLVWDMSKMYGSLQGQTESNVDNAIKLAEAVAPTVLLIDEVEKGMSGSESSGRTDGGVNSRVMGKILTWLQEKKSEVFVVATANSFNGLPPEFLRKGRWDEIWFMGLPNYKEREEIFKVHLDLNKVSLKTKELHEVVHSTENFTGAEIAYVVAESLFKAFPHGRRPVLGDLKEVIKETKIIYQTQQEQIEALLSWATDRARMASSPVNEVVTQQDCLIQEIGNIGE